MESHENDDNQSRPVTQDEVLKALEAAASTVNPIGSFTDGDSQEPSTHSSALLSRLQQNPGELEQVSTVGEQLGFVGSAGHPAFIGHVPAADGLHQTLANIQIYDEQPSDRQRYSASSAYLRQPGVGDEDVDEDMDDLPQSTMDMMNQMSESIRAEAASIATELGVDPAIALEQLSHGGSGFAYDTTESFATGEDEDDIGEDDFDSMEGLEELGFALKPKSKREKRRLAGPRAPILAPDIQALLGEANKAYTERNYNRAIEFYQQVIMKNKSVYQAWNTMGEIQKEMGNHDKALSLFLVAAHLRPKDGEKWKQLGMMSREFGYDQQALYCFGKAVRADRTDVDALWDRSFMYAAVGNTEQAIQGFLRVLQLRPHNMGALEELVKLYGTLPPESRNYKENMQKALQLYEAAYNYYSSQEDPYSSGNLNPFEMDEQEEEVPFGYSALNMLSELYMMFDEYEKPIQCIKTWSLRLQHRSHQLWWDDYADDREFDASPEDEAFQAELGDRRTHGLPVDLRVKLGLCRLMKEQLQFRYLWKCPVEDFSDLYEEVAEYYMIKRMWKDAYKVVDVLLRYPDLESPKIWYMAGVCLRHLNDLEQAKEFLTRAQQADPEDLTTSLVLAEVLEDLEDYEQAREMVQHVDNLQRARMRDSDRRRRDTNKQKQRAEGLVQEEEAGGLRIVMDAHTNEYAQQQRDLANAQPIVWQEQGGAPRRRERRQPTAPTDEELAQFDIPHDETLSPTVAEKFKTLEVIHEKLEMIENSPKWLSKYEAVKTTRMDRLQYLQTARFLTELFVANPRFFPRDRLTSPFRTIRRGRIRQEADPELAEHISSLASRLDRAISARDGLDTGPDALPPVHEPVGATSYLSVPFESWYRMLIQYAVYLTYENRFMEGLDMLVRMFRSNVFYQDPQKRVGIKMVQLACAIWAGSSDVMMDAARWLNNACRMRPFSLRLLMATFTIGGNRLQHPAMPRIVATSSKYLRRQVQIMQEILGETYTVAVRAPAKFRRERTAFGPRRVKKTPLGRGTFQIKLGRTRFGLSLPRDKRQYKRSQPSASPASKASPATRAAKEMAAAHSRTYPGGAMTSKFLAHGGASSSMVSSKAQTRQVSGGRRASFHPDVNVMGAAKRQKRTVDDSSGSEDEYKQTGSTSEDDSQSDSGRRRSRGMMKMAMGQGTKRKIKTLDDAPSSGGATGDRGEEGGAIDGADPSKSAAEATAESGSSEVVNSAKNGVSKQLLALEIDLTGQRSSIQPTKPSIHLLMYTGYLFNLSRSYMGAIRYYLPCYELVPTEPMINFHLGANYLETVMRRTTRNRQWSAMAGLTFMQQYYHLRRQGFGTIAFAAEHRQALIKLAAKGAEWEGLVLPKSIKATNSLESTGPTDATASTPSTAKATAAAAAAAVAAANSTTTDAESSKANVEKDKSSEEPTQSTDAEVTTPAELSKKPRVMTVDQVRAKAYEISADAITLSQTTHATIRTHFPKGSPLSVLEGTTQDDVLAKRGVPCLQEAEYNLARAFHHLGQFHLAIAHYERVLVLPSWKTIVQAQAEGKTLEIPSTDSIYVFDDEEDEDVDEEQVGGDEERGENGDEMGERAHDGEDEEDDDDDPTDLRREAAYNLSLIYAQLGTPGMSQFLMRKYCSI
ncbi:transcription factor TFIIIC subunit tfc4 [Actinomortierella wolfii]|nr:transcription factor TFIIIC subunit tfc4 [Actinomortierella wolfii]